MNKPTRLSLALLVASLLFWDAHSLSARQVSDGPARISQLSVPAAGSITTAMLANGSVDTNKLGSGAVDTTKILFAAVTTNAIAGLAVDTGKLATDSVTTAKIQGAAVDTNKLATDAVTGIKIIAGAVDTTKLATDAVSTVKILAGAVDTTKLASGAVDTTKMKQAAVTTLAFDPAASVTVTSGTFTGSGAAAYSISTSSGISIGGGGPLKLYTNGSIVFGDDTVQTTKPASATSPTVAYGSMTQTTNQTATTPWTTVGSTVAVPVITANDMVQCCWNSFIGNDTLNRDCFLRLIADGVSLGAGTQGSNTAGGQTVGGFYVNQSACHNSGLLSAVAHNFVLQLQNDGSGTCTMLAASQPTWMFCQEIRIQP